MLPQRNCGSRYRMQMTLCGHSTCALPMQKRSWQQHIQSLQEEDGRLSLELDDMRVDVAINESSVTTTGMKKRSDRRLEIKTEIRQATTEDTRLRKEEAKE